VSTLQNTVYLVVQPETEQNEPGPYILQCADWYAMPMGQYEKSECWWRSKFIFTFAQQKIRTNQQNRNRIDATIEDCLQQALPNLRWLKMRDVSMELQKDHETSHVEWARVTWILQWPSSKMLYAKCMCSWKYWLMHLHVLPLLREW
jgi:hypothetical protein